MQIGRGGRKLTSKIEDFVGGVFFFIIRYECVRGRVDIGTLFNMYIDIIYGYSGYNFQVNPTLIIEIGFTYMIISKSMGKLQI